MYEPEPDTHWGFSFFDVDHIFSSHYYGDSKQHEVRICHEHYAQDSHYDTGYRDSHYETGYSDVDNDVCIAHALQEELMQLSIAEASESSVASEENLQTSSESHDWHSPVQNYYIGDEAGLEEPDDVEPSSSCSSPGDRLYDGEEYSYTLEISDDFDIDGEVGKRLNQMNPIPHIPRINGDIPSVDEATSDHQRLLDRLQLYDLVEHRVEGDGNCQFRALSDQFYRTPEHHKFVRKQIFNQLKAHPDMYEGYVPMAYGDYLKRISKGGEWGDHVTLQAAADSYGVKVLVLTSFKDTCYIEILPKIQKSKRVIFLSFWAEVHYNSIYPRVDLPPCDLKKKKKWWMFRNKQEF